MEGTPAARGVRSLWPVVLVLVLVVVLAAAITVAVRDRAVDQSAATEPVHTSTSVSRAEFLARAQRACAGLQQVEADTLPGLLRADANADTVRAAAGRLEPEFSRVARDLAAGGLPDADAASLRVGLVDRLRWAARYAEKARNLAGGDPTTVQATLLQLTLALRDADRTAREYGADACTLPPLPAG